jgi:2,4-dienoyl-CoA reductase-like NADH-dependent reductase (Old Yellow Enzyme family)
VRDSGLDGVDIQGSHGALVSEFLSARMNRRKDRYGGSVENRTRFLLEIIARIKEHVGNDIAVRMRLFGGGPNRGGNTIEDTVEIARLLDGKLDWITPDKEYFLKTFFGFLMVGFCLGKIWGISRPASRQR